MIPSKNKSKNKNKTGTVFDEYDVSMSEKPTHTLIKYIADETFDVVPIDKLLEEADNVRLNGEYDIVYNEEIFKALVLVLGNSKASSSELVSILY